MIDKKITFVFGSVRKNKIESEKNYAKEFFYSYFDLKKKYVDTNLIESGEVQKTEYGQLLDELKLDRYCCRRMFLTHVDIIDVI